VVWVQEEAWGAGVKMLGVLGLGTGSHKCHLKGRKGKKKGVLAWEPKTQGTCRTKKKGGGVQVNKAQRRVRAKGGQAQTTGVILCLGN